MAVIQSVSGIIFDPAMGCVTLIAVYSRF